VNYILIEPKFTFSLKTQALNKFEWQKQQENITLTLSCHQVATIAIEQLQRYSDI